MQRYKEQQNHLDMWARCWVFRMTITFEVLIHPSMLKASHPHGEQLS